VLECVLNISEGADDVVLDALSGAAGAELLDRHADPDHNRSVFTLAGDEVEAAARRLTRLAVASLDLRQHRGVHPRLGVVDVVPFVPLDGTGAPMFEGGDLHEALAARDLFANWAAQELALPCFCYGPERSLPEIRRRAFVDLSPDTGPHQPHPSAGACCVGARPALVAYNLWLDSADLHKAKSVAGAVRRPGLRTLGLAVSGVTQVSCNLTDPLHLGPAQAYDLVAEAAARADAGVTRAELVGLAPGAVVEAVAPERREQLDLSAERTVEARLTARRRAG
jgi:glutamate formiminotransferase / 5-formyltetrahydrofolate cyclo-ligase